MPEPEKPYLTISEAAARIGVTPKTLRRWERDGKIEPAARTPVGHRRYRVEDVDRMIRV